MTDRRRNTLILLIVAGLVPRRLAAIAAEDDAPRASTSRAASSSSTRASPRPQSKVDTESLERAIDIMRKRVDQLGVAQPEIQRTGEDEIDVALPDVSNATQAEEEVGKTAQLHFYDWEPNVIGAERQAGADRTDRHRRRRTRRRAVRGLTEYQAVLRAAKRPPILRKNDTTWSPGCTPQQDERLHLRQLVPARHRRTKRCCAGPRKPNRTLRRRLQTAARRQARRPVRVNPGTVLVQARAGRKRHGQGHRRLAQQLVRAQRRSGAERRGHQEPAAELRRRRGGPASPNVTFGFTSHGKSVSNRSPRKSPTAARKRSCPASTKEEALQHFAVVLDGQLITVAVDRLHQVPGRDRRHHRLGDLRRLHDHLGPEPRQRAAVRRAADQAGTDLPLAGLGDARQTGAQPGPDRGPRGLRGRVPVPAALLPRARRDRRRRPDHLRRLLLRADQADPDHADAARDRRPDPHDRRLRRREHRDLRARQGGDPRRQIDHLRASPRATSAASRRSSTPTS